MGLVESKVLAQSVLIACRRAEVAGQSELDHNLLWEDEAIRKAVKSICRYIPRNIRGSSRQSGLKRAVRTNSKLKIPEVVEELQSRRETLFSEAPVTKDGDVRYGANHNSQVARLSSLHPGVSIAHCYASTVYYERQRDLGKIRLRLLYVVFYRLKQATEPGSQCNFYSAPNFIAQVIQNTGSTEDSTDTIRKNIRTWVGYGERYELLANDLGGLGVLYILPNLGGESLWTKELPKSADNENRTSVIERLKRQEIPIEAVKRGLHGIANEEVEGIFRPLQNSLREVLERGLSEAHHSYRTRSDLSQHSGNRTATERPPNASDVNGGYNIQPFRSQLPFQQLANGASSSSHHGVGILPGPQHRLGSHNDGQSPVQYHMHAPQNGDALSVEMSLSDDPNQQNLYSIPSTNETGEAAISLQQQQRLSNSESANILPRYQYNTIGSGSDYITMMPTNHPQVFPLPSATTMVPSNHPQFFPHQPISTILPMNYPQVFPFQNSANAPLHPTRMETEGLQSDEAYELEKTELQKSNWWERQNQV
ncbi:hypothetical protein IFM5058_09662 [Aspergillus udagawae]|nr:hypothetical protein IFM5058_09662 [Aspergillus udagawae]